jgi:menaquinone-dependent protoporphyrinogen oxidase
MDNKVLIAYASKYGATAEIAEKVGEVLHQAGLPAEVLPVKQIRDLTSYDTVILGSAVYIGQWRKEAAKFLKSNEKELVRKQVWLFSSGPSGEGDPVELLQGWQFPKGLQEIADRIQPRDIAVFHGYVNMEKVNFIEKSMITNIKAPVGDFRNWEAITAWASGIARALKAGV